MSRKTARTFLVTHFKCITLASVALFISSVTSCDDKNENEPQAPEDNIIDYPIVGKWQKYQRINEDGSFSVGDLDEFWIFEEDGTFQNEDSGEICSIGDYTLNDNILTIHSLSTDDNAPENFTGTVSIEANYMTYTYTVIGDDDYQSYRFKKM